MEDDDFGAVRRLLQLISAERIEGQIMDEETVAVALFDLGEFIRYYPNGKAIAKRLGAQAVVMPLLNDDSDEIQREALPCISKMLVKNWQAAVGS